MHQILFLGPHEMGLAGLVDQSVNRLSEIQVLQALPACHGLPSCQSVLGCQSYDVFLLKGHFARLLTRQLSAFVQNAVLTDHHLVPHRVRRFPPARALTCETLGQKCDAGEELPKDCSLADQRHLRRSE